MTTDRWLDIYKFHHHSKTVELVKELRLTENSFDFHKAPTLTNAGSISPADKFLGDYVQQVNYKERIYCIYPIVPQTNADNNPSDIQL